jgi:hypothetical protein
LEVVSDLEELEVIETALGCFESLSNSLYLSPDVDEGFGVSGSWDLGIFKISQHEIEFRARKKIHTLLEVPGVSPPIFLSQSIPFGYCFCFCLGEVKDIPELFFKEKDFFDRGSFIDLDHLRDEKMFFFSPSIHMFQQAPFHLPEFFSVEGPAFSFERFSKLDEGIFEVIPEPLHDVEVVVLEEGFGPDFTDDFGEGGPEVEDNTVRMDAPILKVSKKSFSNATAIEPGSGFDIEDSALESISGDLFISASSSGHVFIDREGSRELELAEDLREVILGGKTFLPSVQGGFGPSGIETSGHPFSDTSQSLIILNHPSHGF